MDSVLGWRSSAISKPDRTKKGAWINSGFRRTPIPTSPTKSYGSTPRCVARFPLRPPIQQPDPRPGNQSDRLAILAGIG